MESLEDRQFLSASHGHGGFGAGGGHGGLGGHGDTVTTLQFSQVPAAVQTGLDALATNAGLTDPTATSTVYLGNVSGAETYSVVISGTGTTTRLTVDDTGAPVTAAVKSTTTWATLSGSGTGSNSAAAAEITAIAAALGLTAPASTTTVGVTTASDGSVTYSVNLGTSSATGKGSRGGATITVDAKGNPVGNQTLPFSVVPAVIQNALNANAPAGATAIASDSTQRVSIRTQDGLTTYTVTFAGTGTQTSVTVNKAGALTTLPGSTDTTFAAVPAAAQTALQTLATANGFTGTIAADQVVSAYAAGDGETLYTVRLPVTETDSTGSTYTENLTITVDASGSPTVLPSGADRGGGDCGPVAASATSTSTSGASNSTAAAAAVRSTRRRR